MPSSAPRHPCLQRDTPFAIAHRGGRSTSDPASTPENSMAAFRHAVSLGYRVLETDVHLTSDGVLVAAHDADLSRVASVDLEISDVSWEQLSAVDLGAGERVPLMAELFEAFPDAAFVIDPKADASALPLAELILSAEAVDRVMVGSFDDARIRAIQERVGPELCTSPGPMELLTYLSAGETPTDAFATHGCLQIPPRFGQFEITPSLLEHAHELGRQVHVWTINERDEMERLLDLGVDAIITDETELLRSLLIEREQWKGTA